MQGSAKRMLEAIAYSLRDFVAPRVQDEFARTQLEAAAEVLENLAVRVDWRADLHEPSAGLHELLAGACAHAPRSELPITRAWLAAHADNPAASAWSERLEALAEVQAWIADPATDEPALRVELQAFLQADFERERRLLRTGMFSRREGDGE